MALSDGKGACLCQLHKRTRLLREDTMPACGSISTRQLRHSAMESWQKVSCFSSSMPHLTSQQLPQLCYMTGSELIQHPPYSPDLAPLSFLLFPNMRKTINCKAFPGWWSYDISHGCFFWGARGNLLHHKKTGTRALLTEVSELPKQLCWKITRTERHYQAQNSSASPRIYDIYCFQCL